VTESCERKGRNPKFAAPLLQRQRNYSAPTPPLAAMQRQVSGQRDVKHSLWNQIGQTNTFHILNGVHSD
jgi:hypothetical protein